ncbi:MAG: FAD-binding protein [bacterium]|nr:FAD-binding protein [bacterium]
MSRNSKRRYRAPSCVADPARTRLGDAPAASRKRPSQNGASSSASGASAWSKASGRRGVQQPPPASGRGKQSTPRTSTTTPVTQVSARQRGSGSVQKASPSPSKDAVRSDAASNASHGRPSRSAIPPVSSRSVSPSPSESASGSAPVPPDAGGAAAGPHADTFAATVARYNELAAKGEDEDFGRAGLVPLAEEGPYYAIKVIRSTVAGFGGFEINTDAQVLKEDGTAFPNLFAAGECASGQFFATVYPCSGSMLSISTTYGRVAGKNAAALALAE